MSKIPSKTAAALQAIGSMRMRRSHSATSARALDEARVTKMQAEKIAASLEEIAESIEAAISCTVHHRSEAAKANIEGVVDTITTELRATQAHARSNAATILRIADAE